MVKGRVKTKNETETKVNSKSVKDKEKTKNISEDKGKSKNFQIKKKSTTGYIIFGSEIIQRDKDKVSGKNLMFHIGEEWCKLDQNTKEEYNKKAKELNEEVEEEKESSNAKTNEKKKGISHLKTVRSNKDNKKIKT